MTILQKKLGGCIIITNCDKSSLQITTAKLLLITTKFYYKLRQLICYKLRQFYYKLRQLLQIATNFLQITTAITNCDSYYKLRRNTPMTVANDVIEILPAVTDKTINDLSK